MTSASQTERCNEKKSAVAARNTTLVRLQDCCKTLSGGVGIPAHRTVGVDNVQQWLEQLPADDKRLVVDAWNAWIKATAQYYCVQFESRTYSDDAGTAHHFRILAVSIFICALAFWIDLRWPHAFANAVLMSVGTAAATWVAFGTRRSIQSRERMVRARLKARAVAWHIAGWQLNPAGNAFFGEIYPWKYDALGLRLYAPKIRFKLS